MVFIINSLFWIYLFIIHWSIFIFSFPKLFFYSIFLLDIRTPVPCTPIIYYVFLFLVNVIISIYYSIIGFPFYVIIIHHTCLYLLFYHWVSIICNNHTSPQNIMKNRIRILTSLVHVQAGLKLHLPA